MKCQRIEHCWCCGNPVTHKLIRPDLDEVTFRHRYHIHGYAVHRDTQFLYAPVLCLDCLGITGEDDIYALSKRTREILPDCKMVHKNFAASALRGRPYNRYVWYLNLWDMDAIDGLLTYAKLAAPEGDDIPVAQEKLP